MDILSAMLDIIEREYPGIAADRPRLEKVLRLNCGGDRHYIASAAALERAERNAAIRGLLDSGLNSEEVAQRVGLTGQAVRKIRASA